MRREKGQSLVEFAILLPFLVLLLSGLLDLGRIFYVQVTLRDAASEGVTYATIHPYDADGIWRRAAEATGGMIAVSPADVDVEYPSVMHVGAPITVTVRYEFRPITPFIGDLVPEGVLLLKGTATRAILSLR